MLKKYRNAGKPLPVDRLLQIKGGVQKKEAQTGYWCYDNDDHCPFTCANAPDGWAWYCDLHVCQRTVCW